MLIGFYMVMESLTRQINYYNNKNGKVITYLPASFADITLRSKSYLATLSLNLQVKSEF